MGLRELLSAGDTCACHLLNLLAKDIYNIDKERDKILVKDDVLCLHKGFLFPIWHDRTLGLQSPFPLSPLPVTGRGNFSFSRPLPTQENITHDNRRRASTQDPNVRP
jgi:hypothetical protein